MESENENFIPFFPPGLSSDESYEGSEGIKSDLDIKQIIFRSEILIC